MLGRLEVVTIPAGARVSIDGKVAGTTRIMSGGSRSQILAVENVPAGDHSVLVHLDGYQDTSRKILVKAKDTSKITVKLPRIFQVDTELETISGIHRGVLVETDFLGNVTIEVSPGVQQTFRKEDIRKVKSLK